VKKGAGMDRPIIVKNEISILASSDPQAGALNVRDQGSRFDIEFSEEIVIPSDAKNINCQLAEGNIWNSVPNISTTLNNNHVLITISGNPIDCVIPNGLYTPSELSSSINFIVSNAFPAFSGYITLTPEYSTNKVLLNFNANVAMSFDLSVSNSMATLLGFTATNHTNGGVIVSQRGTSVARFNNINTFLLHSNLVSSGMSYNGQQKQILAAIPISSAPGELILYNPPNPTFIPEQYMNGRRISQLTFYITDEDNNAVDLSAETWLVRVKISWDSIMVLR
jgi:hypothetical protein